MAVKLILAVRDKDDKRYYLKYMQQYDAEIDTVGSLGELYQTLKKKAFNGILIDLPTRLMAQSDERIIMREALGTYPVCMCKLDHDTGDVKVMLQDDLKAADRMECFLSEQCARFKARKIRKAGRHDLNFKALLVRNKKEPQKEKGKTITLNVSGNGVFLYGVEERNIGDKVTFVIQELKDKTPITGIVRWKTTWETPSKIPGYGIEFSEITQNQVEQISNMVIERNARHPAFQKSRG